MANFQNQLDDQDEDDSLLRQLSLEDGWQRYVKVRLTPTGWIIRPVIADYEDVRPSRLAEQELPNPEHDQRP